MSEADIFHAHLRQCRSDDEVSEVFSLRRIVPMAEKKGRKGGRSCDLANGWDLLRADHFKQCLKILTESKPLAVMVLPPCVEYSSIQNLNHEHNEGDRRKKIEAQTLLDFAMQICRAIQFMPCTSCAECEMLCLISACMASKIPAITNITRRPPAF